MNKPQGWKGDSLRHGLARRGIDTSRLMTDIGIRDINRAVVQDGYLPNYDTLTGRGPSFVQNRFGMAQRYCRIIKNDFERVMARYNAKVVDVPGSRELVYEIQPPSWKKDNLSVLVYSSIIMTGQARDCGDDAIRVVAVLDHDPKKIVSGRTKTLRIDSWEKNLTAKIDDLLQYEPVTCPRCGSMMVVRTNKRTKEKFMGCSQWPKCSQTMPIKRRDTSLQPKKAPAVRKNNPVIRKHQEQIIRDFWDYENMIKSLDDAMKDGRLSYDEKQWLQRWASREYGKYLKDPKSYERVHSFAHRGKRR